MDITPEDNYTSTEVLEALEEVFDNVVYPKE